MDLAMGNKNVVVGLIAILFWGRWMNPEFSGGWISQVVYPMKFAGGVAMGVALLLTLIVFLQGAKQATAGK